MTTQVLAEILVKCGIVKASEVSVAMLGRIAEVAVMVSAREADWQAHAEQSDRELCELQDALGCPAELRLVECDRCDWHGTTRDATLPGQCPQDCCGGRLIDGGIADAQTMAMERIRDLIAQEAELAEACMDYAAKDAERGNNWDMMTQWQAHAERLAQCCRGNDVEARMIALDEFDRFTKGQEKP